MMILFYAILYSIAYIAVGLMGMYVYFVLGVSMFLSLFGMAIVWAVISASVLFNLSKKEKDNDKW